LRKGKSKGDPLVKNIERALRPGKFVSYGQSWDFIRDLEEAKKGIDALVAEAARWFASRKYICLHSFRRCLWLFCRDVRNGI